MLPVFLIIYQPYRRVCGALVQNHRQQATVTSLKNFMSGHHTYADPTLKNSTRLFLRLA